MPYFRINHSEDIRWKEDDVTFVVVMASHIAPGGLSDFVFTNGRQKDLSKKIVTTGHFSVVHMREFDVFVESGITCIVATMQLVGIGPLKRFLDTAAVSRPLSFGVLRDVLIVAEQQRSLDDTVYDSDDDD